MSDSWPQRAKFRELVRSYVTRNGLTNDQVGPFAWDQAAEPAEMPAREHEAPRPEGAGQGGRGVPVQPGELFLDNPGAVVPDGLEAVDQFRFETMVEKMNEPDLTAADRQILFEDFLVSWVDSRF